MCLRWVVRAGLPFLTLFLGGFLGFSLLEIRSRSAAVTQSFGLCKFSRPSAATPAPTGSPFPPAAAAGRREFSVLIGILTVPDKYEMRHFLRLIYAAQGTPVEADIDIKFVLCSLTTEEQKLMVALEILRFDDIIVLDCAENMDGGKTYTYFSSLPAILPRRYDYVMKADDDTFVGLGALARSLRPLPREDLYYGYVTPCWSRDPFSGYMSGMGYLLSWDLVEWISTSEIPRRNAVGTEDVLVGEWLKRGKKARNRHTPKPAMYDFPGSKYKKCAHELVPETVAVHQVKTRERWMALVRYFNLAKPLKPSKLYDIDF